MSSCSVRCTPNFFSPIVRSLTQMPPSPLTSRTWNSTFSLCSCSDPPHVLPGCADSPGSEWQLEAKGFDGEEDDEGSPACPPPPPGSTPGWVSADRHWQDPSLSKEVINEPCCCIGALDVTPPLRNTDRASWLTPRHMPLHSSRRFTEGKNPPACEAGCSLVENLRWNSYLTW